MATAAMKVGERKKKVIIDTDPGIGPYRPSILLVSSPVSTAIDCNQPVDRSFPWRRRRDGHPGGAAVAGAGGAGPHHHLRQRPHRRRHPQRAPPGVVSLSPSHALRLPLSSAMMHRYCTKLEYQYLDTYPILRYTDTPPIPYRKSIRK